MKKEINYLLSEYLNVQFVWAKSSASPSLSGNGIYFCLCLASAYATVCLRSSKKIIWYTIPFPCALGS